MQIVRTVNKYVHNYAFSKHCVMIFNNARLTYKHNHVIENEPATKCKTMSLGQDSRMTKGKIEVNT